MSNIIFDEEEVKLPECFKSKLVYFNDGIMKFSGQYRQRYRFICEMCYKSSNPELCKRNKTELGEIKTKQQYKNYVKEAILRDIAYGKKQS